MACKVCDRFWDRFWVRTDAWERAHSNDDELFSAETDQSWDLIQQASVIEETDPRAAFQHYLTAAEAGSVWSMQRIGWSYWTGTGVAANTQSAQEWFSRAISGGSWMATISYARLLAELGDHDRSEEVLSDGVSSDFVPAYFWLAWVRYERTRTRETRRQVRTLLEYAASKGHPAAKLYLERWMVLGSFKLREIPRGLRLLVQGSVSYAFQSD